MSEIAALHPVIRTWLFEGPLSSHVSAYVARLRRGRYAPSTVGHCLNGIAHFSHWMAQCSLPAQLLDEGWIEARRETAPGDGRCPRFAAVEEAPLPSRPLSGSGTRLRGFPAALARLASVSPGSRRALSKQGLVLLR